MLHWFFLILLFPAISVALFVPTADLQQKFSHATYISLSHNSSIVVAWQDHNPVFKDEQIKAVRITVGVAGIFDGNVSTTVWRFELGMSYTQINVSQIYYVLVEYMDHRVNPTKVIATIPYYVVPEQTNKLGCGKGVYDLIIKSQLEKDILPSGYEKVVNDFFKGTYFPKVAPTDKEKYDYFCIIMAESPSDINVIPFRLEFDFFISDINTAAAYVSTVDDKIVENILGNDKPGGDFMQNAEAGFFGEVAGGFTAGIYNKNDFYELFLGIGFDEAPHSGLLLKEGATTLISRPMPGVVLGRKSPFYHGDGAFFCSEMCEAGKMNKTTGCPIPYPQWHKEFCNHDPESLIAEEVACKRRNCGEALRAAEITMIDGLSLTSLKVTWESLPREFREGGITKYVLHVYKGPTLTEYTLLANQTNLTINGMEENVEYNFTLITFTKPEDLLALDDHKVVSETKKFTILSKVFAKPDTIPYIIELKNTSHNSLSVKWDNSETFRTWKTEIKLEEIPDDVNADPILRGMLLIDPVNKTDNYEFTDLKIYQMYKVTIHHLNDIGDGDPDSRKARTDEYPPGLAPGGFVVNSNPVQPKKVTLLWNHLESEQNGIILGYHVIAQLYNGEITEKKVPIDTVLQITQTLQLDNLQENSLYNFSIAAYNSKGYSPYAVKYFKTYAAVPDIPTKLTVFNTSDLSLNVSWYMDEFMWNSEPLGIILSYHKKDDDFEVTKMNLTYWNLTSENGSFFCEPPFYMIELTGLAPYQKYTVYIHAYNNEGDGKSTKKVTASTEEQAPLVPPEGLVPVTDEVKNTYVIIKWKKLKDSQIFGVKHGWTICWIPIYTDDHITVGTLLDGDPPQEYTRDLQTDRECDRAPTEQLSYKIKKLIGHTEYNITVAFNTKFLGVATEPLVVTTQENYAPYSVYQIRCETMSPAQIRLNWVLAPLAYTRGSRRSYDIEYKFRLRGYDLTRKVAMIPGDSTSLYVGNLEPWTDYDFSISLKTGFELLPNTTQRVMNESISNLKCMTLPSVPEDYPDTVNATSRQSPNTSTVIWNEIDQYEWKGIKEGYTIEYRAKKVGDVPVFATPIYIVLKLKEINFYDGFFNITLNLSVFTRYELRIAARTQKGVGLWSVPVEFETCNTESNVIQVLYDYWDPYISQSMKIGNRTIPTGVLMPIFEQAIVTCASTCGVFNNRPVQIIYEKLSKKPEKMDESKLYLPHSATGRIDPNFNDLILGYSPGFTLIERKLTSEQQTVKNEELFIDGIKNLMPLIVFYFLVNGLFGCIFFFVETYNVTYQKRGKSWAGMFEGLYLAIATSTTVGYGDKIPLSAFGRCYMVLWTLIGLVLTGIVVGALSSALTVASKSNKNYPKEKTAAIKDSLAHAFVKKHFQTPDETEWLNASAILKEMSRDSENELRFALFETNEVEFVYKHEIAQLNLVVHGTYSTASPLGAIAFNEAKKLTKCAEEVAIEKAELIENAFEDLRKTHKPTQTREDDKPQPLVQWSAPIYQDILLGMCLTFVFFCLLGIIYELIRRRILCRKARAKIRPESREKKDKELQDMKDLLEDFEDDFEKMKTKMAREGQVMIYKHGEEVLQLFGELKRFSGVDLKYAKESDLVLPLRTILAMKEEQLRRNKISKMKK